MHPPRYPAVLTAVTLLVGLHFGCDAGQVLVPGNPPLTQGHVNTYTRFAEHVFAIKLDEESREALHALVVADWKGWDRAARDDFLKQLVAWETVSKKADRFAYRAKRLPGYLDRQGDPDKTSAAERWLLEAYQSVYKKKGEERPIDRMEKPPPPHPALRGNFGFPADPKPSNVLPTPLVFSRSQTYMRHGSVDTYVSRRTGEVKQSHQYWWFFPTGRFYTRNVRCLGTECVNGTERMILVNKYYLDSEQVSELCGRYTIDDKDRVQMETDRG
jgi:hypothetical protein